MSAPADRARPTLAAILAGGEGRRLGAPKAIAELGGRPLISYAIGAAREAGLHPLVVAKAGSPLPQLDCQLLTEPAEPRHPLCGLVAALRRAAAPIVAMTCDMPFVPASLLARLAAEDAELVLTDSPAGPQPFPGRYAPQLLPQLERALERQQPMRRALEPLGPLLISTEELERLDDPERIAFNVNTPHDLEAAAELIAERRHGGGASGP